eukprot:CAMPEP_0197938520 /NCGR_PEP_ID=MMETSP1439-20131203/118268_1 /TAXON_ID=66791 /ORGANISM="Gonyaulax spinifera, Strain CCMP409" /LENGTH=69 /DNA_ID=CAMNT_0043561595 /DNA_START=45 /DNA_END=251 /DNA_ORIENTATION=+
MCADLGWATDRDGAGFVAGFLQSANTMGRIPTGMLWGCLGDRIGISNAMMLSMVFIALGGLLFGLCTNF